MSNERVVYREVFSTSFIMNVAGVTFVIPGWFLSELYLTGKIFLAVLTS